MIHIIKFFLIIIVYIISAIIAIPILIFRVAHIMSSIMIEDMFHLANNSDENNPNDNSNESSEEKK